MTGALTCSCADPEILSWDPTHIFQCKTHNRTGPTKFKDVLKPPSDLLAADHSKAVVILTKCFWSRCFMS